MIKNIIFDFGDIFINLDKKAPELELNKVGIEQIDQEMLQWHSFYEKGLITSEILKENYLKRFPKIDPVDFGQAWNSILLDFPEVRLDWIKALSASNKYRLFLLSNTNAMHIDQVINIMGAERYEVFRECFEGFYLSHELQLSKPDPIIYKYVVEANGLKANETLFIDDTAVNTEAAAKLGLNVWNLQPGQEDITDLFTTKKELF